MPPNVTPLLQRRSTILAISAAIIAGVGAYAGALLKTDVEKIGEAQKVRAETVEERIERLKGYRANLEVQRGKLFDKIQELRRKDEEERTGRA